MVLTLGKIKVSAAALILFIAAFFIDEALAVWIICSGCRA